jgi:HNH endonuclease
LAPAAPASVAMRPPEINYKVQFTVSHETHAKLRRVQELMRHAIPDGDPAAIFDRALTVLLADLTKAKCGATERPRTGQATQLRSRHIPAAVKRAVWQRDGGRCAFEGKQGRCSETGLLEYHHVVPYADSGEASVSNIQLRCRTHNRYEAELWFGVSSMPVARESRSIYGT